MIATGSANRIANAENSFEIDADGERYKIGGSGAFLEDFEAESVTLEYPEE